MSAASLRVKFRKETSTLFGGSLRALLLGIKLSDGRVVSPPDAGGIPGELMEIYR
jgi:hypothetical protein